MLHGEGLDRLVGEKLGLELGEPDLAEWDELLERIAQPARASSRSRSSAST